MKKLAALVAACLLVAGTAAGCSNTDNDDQAKRLGPGCCET